MAYSKKTWKDRISEYQTRRTLIDESGNSAVYTVERNEGVVSEPGDAFSATNMNDLENRISNEFTTLDTNVSSISNSLKNWGTFQSKDGSATVTSGKGSSIISYTVPYAGVWLFVAKAMFPTNANGYRFMKITTTSTSFSNDVKTAVSYAASSGNPTIVQNVTIMNLSANAKVYVNLWQNSGSSLKVSSNMLAIKIK